MYRFFSSTLRRCHELLFVLLWAMRLKTWHDIFQNNLAFQIFRTLGLLQMSSMEALYAFTNYFFTIWNSSSVYWTWMRVSRYWLNFQKIGDFGGSYMGITWWQLPGAETETCTSWSYPKGMLARDASQMYWGYIHTACTVLNLGHI